MKIDNKEMKVIESALLKIYSKYKNKGLLSVYLWGTVLTEEFNPELSDIDSIGIVNNTADEKDCDTIKNLLEKYAPKYKDFKLNYLYLNELNGGRVRSRLAKVIPPSLLLLDFEHWKHIAGIKYSRENFKLEKISFDEAIRLNIDLIKKRHLPLIEQGDFKCTQYLIKSLLNICHYLNQKEKGKHNFRYNRVLKNSPKERKKVVEILLEIKQNKWDQQLMKKNFPFLIKFINKLEEKRG
ncbi:MAG: hypothetical protein ABH804_01320 [archaeon]